MTIKEIKRRAKLVIARDAINCTTLVIFAFAMIVLFVLCEMLIFLGLHSMKLDKYYDLRLFLTDRDVNLFWVIKSLIEFTAMVPMVHMIRRLMVDMALERDINETKGYIGAHFWGYFKRCLRASVVLLGLKVFTAVPGVIGIYGVYHWTYIIRIDELTSLGLFCLTASLSLTCTWAILWVHYLLSLSLTPLIMTLNPRSSIFDACDLSVKLMSGRRGQYIRFLLAYLKYLPGVVLIYPCLLVVPYFYVSRIMFQMELLGDRGKDKLPGMVKRWRKYELMENAEDAKGAPA